jgi:hypothetical protein
MVSEIAESGSPQSPDRSEIKFISRAAMPPIAGHAISGKRIRAEWQSIAVKT